ncbi:MAG: hypothetical protein N2484_01815 [Clostridia bacterium]|nr:hypothetical protein [Clostridia bacterium]
MAREIPQKLLMFLKNALKDVDDGYEYSSELNRILNSDDCQHALTSREIEFLREYADKVKSVGEINHYSEERIKDIERDFFGSKGISGFLGISQETKPQWPF